MLSRLKFDLSDTISTMIGYIPEPIWVNKTTTFCDFEMGGGQFIKAVVDKLKLYGHSDENIQSRVFGFSDNELYLSYVIGSDIIGTFDIYNEKKYSNMKFDVIVGNPPYQETSGAATGKSIWHKFVKKSFNALNPNGYLSLIHPSGWRNSSGDFKDIQNLLLSKNIIYLNMNDFRKGREIFGVQTDFDYYCIHNVNNTSEHLTEINDYDNINYNISLCGVSFIPNANIENVYSLVATNGNAIDLISDSSYHHTREYVTNNESDVFKYPIVYSISKSLGVKMKYSSVNDRGHFGVPKVIFTNGSASYPIVDMSGDYGLTQFAYAIVDEPENLENIQKALSSEEFIKNVMLFRGLGNIYNRKIISTLKKDFWKEFI
jgi:hypothetical protein